MALDELFSKISVSPEDACKIIANIEKALKNRGVDEDEIPYEILAIIESMEIADKVAEALLIS